MSRPHSIAAKTLVAAALSIIAAGCGGSDGGGGGACAADVGSVTYRENVQFILFRYCIECHDKTKKTDAERQKAPYSHNYNSYALITRARIEDPTTHVVSVVNLAPEMLLRIVDDAPEKVMPPSKYENPMDPCSMRTVRKWVDEGTPE